MGANSLKPEQVLYRNCKPLIWVGFYTSIFLIPESNGYLKCLEIWVSPVMGLLLLYCSLSDMKRQKPGSAETDLSQLPGSKQTVVHD